VTDQRNWWEDLDPAEYALLFPRGQRDVDAFLERQRWREQHQNFPAKCEDAPALMDMARIILGASAG
jgi:hypothetical protein